MLSDIIFSSFFHASAAAGETACFSVSKGLLRLVSNQSCLYAMLHSKQRAAAAKKYRHVSVLKHVRKRENPLSLFPLTFSVISLSRFASVSSVTRDTELLFFRQNMEHGRRV